VTTAPPAVVVIPCTTATSWLAVTGVRIRPWIVDDGLWALIEPGDVVYQGEDLGRWVRSVRLGWDNLSTVQQWMCEQVLGIEPAGRSRSVVRKPTSGR
jgi:hypothetical protein